jgi:phosphoribosylformylglycinamidine (FGAM) synthase-like enzyme
MKYVTHPDTTVAVAMVAGDEVAVRAEEVAMDVAAEVVVTVAVAEAVVEKAEETTNVLFKKSLPIPIIRNLPRQHPEEAETLAQPRAPREVTLVLSSNSLVVARIDMPAWKND